MRRAAWVQEREHLSFQVEPLTTAYEQNKRHQEDRQSHASTGLDADAETTTTIGFKADSWCVEWRDRMADSIDWLCTW